MGKRVLEIEAGLITAGFTVGNKLVDVIEITEGLPGGAEVVDALFDDGYVVLIVEHGSFDDIEIDRHDITPQTPRQRISFKRMRRE